MRTIHSITHNPRARASRA